MKQNLVSIYKEQIITDIDPYRAENVCGAFFHNNGTFLVEIDGIKIAPGDSWAEPLPDGVMFHKYNIKFLSDLTLTDNARNNPRLVNGKSLLARLYKVSEK